MTLAEQETVIRWDRQDNVATVYTADPYQWARLDKHPDIYHPVRKDTVKGNTVSKTYQCESRFITFRKSDMRGKRKASKADIQE